MMIDIDLLLCPAEDLCGASQPFFIAVQRYEHVVDLVCGKVGPDILHAVNTIENIRRLLQIDRDLCIRHLFSQIQIQPHAGADTVAVRSHVPADRHRSRTFDFFHYPCLCCHDSLFTSSISFDILTPYAID